MVTINSIGILLFNDVELLDFAGPLEVFTSANYLRDNKLLNIETVGVQKEIIVSKSSLSVQTHSILGEKNYDLLLIPGGMGTRALIKDEALLKRIQLCIEGSTLTASVCTGALILAQLGYLKNLEVCTHHLAFDLLQSIDSSISINVTDKYMDNGKYITSAGVSAGIDMSFYLLQKLYGEEFSKEVRTYIEY